MHTQRGTRWPGWGLWWMCLVVVVWAGWWFAPTMLNAASSDDPPGTVSAADCADAMDFSGATLPEGTRDEDCTSYTWGGQAYDGSFRMPRYEGGSAGDTALVAFDASSY